MGSFGGYLTLGRRSVYEVVMTVRRRFDETELTYPIDYYVENHLMQDPDGFVAAVSRSDIDWEWGRVPA